MPLPIALAHKLAKRLAAVRKAGTLDYLRPDGKTQVTVRYVDGRPVGDRADPHLQPAPRGLGGVIRDDLWEHVVVPVLPADLYDADKLRQSLLVNPTGRFVIGGPVGDAGLTGRKIIVDTYGGMARHGGGAFSGKDPSKVDRSAAYAARHVAKNVVAAGLAERCEVQVAYAIGVAHPVSVMVETFGTESIGRGEDPRAHRRALRPAPRRLPRGPEPAPPDLPAAPPPTGTSGARTRTSRGSAPTRPMRCARTPVSAKRPRSRPRRARPALRRPRRRPPSARRPGPACGERAAGSTDPGCSASRGASARGRAPPPRPR